ncbi:zinc transporter ZIP4-like [Ylistrum balloti]|uniref:zinc transporter ZIP4-like n=1 Tax=Ylistrum balloti TaxID=509963 RepID=UPI002905D702|nr:zinc transporter ZIP4-like [Ylistrum balloti]
MPTDAEIYGYGTLANILCCLCSLGGSFALPCVKKHHSAYHVVLSIFMGLAVGTLASDALLHLIPEALSLHGHHNGEDEGANTTHNDDHDDHQIHVDPYVWYCLIVLAGIYAFYILEVIMASLHGKGKGEAKADLMDGVGNGFGEQKLETLRKLDDNHQTALRVEMQTENKVEKKSYLKPIVVMIVIGDAIHNFTDGLAVAASFNSSIVEGISTSLAIICHELPQELGDFAILMKNGLSFKKALIANLMSSLTALLGFYIGVSLSKGVGASQWIFSIAAGLFLYISMTDMIPELIQAGAGRLKTIIYHNIGILIGVLIILLLSIFEDSIQV